MSIERIIIAAIALLGVLGGMNLYVGRRLFQTLTFLFLNINMRVYTGIYIVVAVSFILARLPLPVFFKRIIGSVGSIWMGIYIPYIVFHFNRHYYFMWKHCKNNPRRSALKCTFLC